MKRSLAVLGIVSAALPAFSQVNLSGAVRSIGNAMQNAAPGPTQNGSQNPNEASGFPQPPSKNEELPPPREYGPQERLIKIVSEGTEWSQSGTKIHATHGVHALYKGYDMFGDTLDGDTQTEVFTLTGHVKIVGSTSTITGEKVTVDVRNRSYISERSEADLKPSFFPSGRLLDDLYLKSGDSFGSAREVFGDLTSVTTCPLPDPHFELISKHADVRPGRRLILRDSQLWILHKHILTIPYLSIPLDNRSSPYTPEVGNSQDEGYFVKLKVPVALHSNNDFLDTRIDYYTKLGNGLGADYDYRNRNLAGRVQLYSILQKNQFELDVHHDERFGHATLSLDNSYQKGNYLISTNNTILNTRATFNLPWQNGSSDQFSFSRSSNASTGFNSVQQLLGLNDNRIFNRWLRSTLNLSYSDNSSSGSGFTGVQSKELDVRLDAQGDLKKATAELEYLRNIPVGQNNNTFFGIADKTPVLTLRSDSSRLLKSSLANELPFQMDISTGQFGTPAFLGNGAEHVTRTSFDFNVQRPDHPDRRFDVNANGRFQQGIYSDNTAQYATGLDTGARYSFGRDTAFNLRYSYLQQHGFTPLDFDRTGQTNLVTSDISLRPFRTFLLAAQTGYDFLQEQQSNTAWQSIGIRGEWRPRDWFQARAVATYDTFQRSWSNIRMDFGYKPGATFISGSATYDGFRHTLGNFNLFVDGFKWGRLKTSMILDYDGYLKQFNARHFSFTYDLHCAEAILQILDNPTGFRPGTQISLFFRLKAFPFNTPFGIGTRGQAVGSGTGRTFF